uniref:Uncharacterized protein n=1 Tax=Nelumbo nucifera TaxID=4432 RepID=A0A822XN22_NELNU|nr:TPA_asm: hypothetical protein HUJ06_023120 [Nelumbo nucifera]
MEDVPDVRVRSISSLLFTLAVTEIPKTSSLTLVVSSECATGKVDFRRSNTTPKKLKSIQYRCRRKRLLSPVAGTLLCPLFYSTVAGEDDLLSAPEFSIIFSVFFNIDFSLISLQVGY